MSVKIKTSAGILAISDRLTGKMTGVNAISTSPLQNPNCVKRAKNKKSICSKCYSMTTMKQYASAKTMYTANGKTLSNSLISMDELPLINAFMFRFESHGDIINTTHLANLANIARKNPRCIFTLWTKNTQYTEQYFSAYPKPKNMIIIYSSPIINKSLNIDNYNHADKIFTVYDKKAAEKVTINCGARSCLSCQRCYKKAGSKYVREVVK